MIIWIASYPKSGNTWVRSLLSTYFYSNDGIFNFDLLKNIKQFPSKQYFDFFLKDFNDIKKISDYWIAAQDRINLLNEKTTFLKTHSALCKLEKNSFTNKRNTKAAIYIVRDPRNLITSFSHHYSISVDKAFEDMTNKNKILTEKEWGSDGFGVATILGTWADHYRSWQSLNFSPKIIIKYEDLIKDTKGTFILILNFLKNLIDIEIDEKRIQSVISSCEFEVLAKKEKLEGFIESTSSKKNDKKINFFYLGKKNNWQNLLDEKIEIKVKKAFNNEMKELNYI